MVGDGMWSECVPRRMQIIGTRLICGVLLLSCSLSTWSGPWLPPGDIAVRHDLQLLSDAGLIGVPLTTWPLSWGDLSQTLSDLPKDGLQAPALMQAAKRLRKRARKATKVRRLQSSLRLSLANEARRIRGFEATPRESAELGAEFEWTGRRFAYGLRITGVEEPSDGQEVRFDGSYAGVVLGNWMLSVNAIDRWWGPTWDGNVLLSSNARPVPALMLERNYADPFESVWLNWIGPWKLTVFLGQLESQRTVPDARLLGMRFNFRPLEELEIGLARTALWCGKGRPCDLDTFGALLAGRDNVGSGGIEEANEPGNQIAGIDFRWQSPLFKGPYAVYGVYIGEDINGGPPNIFPSDNIWQAGLEYWGQVDSLASSYRIFVEYANTGCRSGSGVTRFDCAYVHHIYQTGYRYRGRSIGHGIDNDGRMWSLGGMWMNRSGNLWDVRIRGGDINRDGTTDSDPGHTVSSAARSFIDLSLTNARPLVGGSFVWGVGYERFKPERNPALEDLEDGRIFVQWERDL